MHLQTDGIAKRYNRTLEYRGAAFVKDIQGDWDQHASTLLMSHRTTVHETIRLTHAMLMFGRQLRVPLYFPLERPPEEISDYIYLEYAQRLRTSLEAAHDLTE